MIDVFLYQSYSKDVHMYTILIILVLEKVICHSKCTDSRRY